MKIKYLVLIPTLFVSLISCNNKEDKIIPTEGNEKYFTLPQGNHDFDNRIVELNKTYGFYPLYIFEDKDIYWNYDNWEEFRQGDYRGVITGAPSDPEYVGKQLDLVQDYFFANFSTDLLKKMPKKLLLCSQLTTGQYKRVMNDQGQYELVPVYTRAWCCKAYDYFAVNGGSADIDTYTQQEKNEFSLKMTNLFLSNLLAQKELVPPQEFFDISAKYYTYKTQVLGPTLFEQGLLCSEVVTFVTTPQSSLNLDFTYYVDMVINNTLAKLNGPMDAIGSRDFRPALGGVFNPARDKNGLVLKKYNMVVTYLKQQGINVEYYQTLAQ